MWPRPDMTPKPDDKEGLPARKGDETYGLVTRDEVETRLLYCLKNYPFIDIKTLDLNVSRMQRIERFHRTWTRLTGSDLHNYKY